MAPPVSEERFQRSGAAALLLLAVVAGAGLLGAFLGKGPARIFWVALAVVLLLTILRDRRNRRRAASSREPGPPPTSDRTR